MGTAVPLIILKVATATGHSLRYQARYIMDFLLANEPVSSKSPHFWAVIDQYLTKGRVLVLLFRYSNWGGAKDYFLIRNKDEFDDVLNQARPKTSVTVFFESAFPLKGIASTELMGKSQELLLDEFEEYEGVDVIRLDTQTPYLDEEKFAFLATPQSIQEWFQRNEGAEILVGTMKFWQENNNDVVTVYVPDDDNVIRPGAY